MSIAMYKVWLPGELPSGGDHPNVIGVHPDSVDQHVKAGWRVADAAVVAEINDKIADANAEVARRQAGIDKQQAALNAYEAGEVAVRIAAHQADLAAIAAV